MRRIAGLIGALILWAGVAGAQSPAETQLTGTILRLERDLEARIGVFVAEAGSDWSLGHRADERFLMASTVKSVICGAALAAADRGLLSLDEAVAVRAEEIHGHSPVTAPAAGGSLTIGDLCLATLDQSDNGAANLLIDRMGGTGEVTAFLRGIGDEVTRLDRKEPELNLFVPGDPRDTTSPRAMARTWERLLTGEVLSPEARAQFRDWMTPGGVTGALIRPHLPPGWTIADKSGGGRDHTRNIVALIAAPDRAPWVVAIYLSDTPANWSTRNAAVSEIAAAVVAVLDERAE